RVRKFRESFADHMKDRQSSAQIFNGDIVGDNVTLESRLKRGLKREVGIEQKTILLCVEKQMPVHFSFRIQNARFDRRCFACLANIVGQLAVQETQTIGATDAQL